MTPWRKHPTVYEINTWVWLNELSRAHGRRVTLGDVPREELERLAAYGFDALWLMGVWERSRAARRISRTNPALLEEYARTFPDYTEEDIVGSPYAITGYRVDPSLGGDEGLADFRSRMRETELRLVLDFVPNHVAIDHAWLTEAPERIVQSDAGALAREPQNYFSAGPVEAAHVFAHGRDPYFDGWPDTAQLDYRRVEARARSFRPRARARVVGPRAHARGSAPSARGSVGGSAREALRALGTPPRRAEGRRRQRALPASARGALT